MKKMLLLFVLSLTCAFFVPIVRADTIAFNFNPIFHDDTFYNLDTGVSETHKAYSSTSKMAINRDDLTIEASEQFSYVFFWDRYGVYMGYAVINGTQISGAYYLAGVVFHGAGGLFFEPPTGTRMFAISSATGSGDLLATETWYDTFETPSYIAYTDDVITGVLGDLFATPTYLDFVTPYAGQTLDEIFTPAIISIPNLGYSRTAINGALADFTAYDITVLSLTNLIQNGQMTGNINNWSTAGTTATYDNGMAKVIATAQYGGIFQEYNFVSGQNYYGALSYIKDSTSQRIFSGGSGYLADGNATSTLTVLSFVYGATATGIARMTCIRDYRTSGWSYFWIDNVSLFNSSTYTKTQIDTALASFGYLTYNLQYDLPDLTDGDFTDNYKIRGSGIGIDTDVIDYEAADAAGYFSLVSAVTGFATLDRWRSIWGDGLTTYVSVWAGFDSSMIEFAIGDGSFDDNIGGNAVRDYYIDLYRDADAEHDRYEWYAQLGITTSNYAYYQDLYTDALAMNERWEWYLWAGLDEELYDASIDDYADILNQFAVTPDFATFNNLLLEATFEGVDEVPADIWDTFDGLLSPAIRTIAAVILIGLCIFFLMMKGAPLGVIFLLVAILFIFFVLVEWLPAWWGIVLAGAGFLLFILPLLKGGGNSD